MMARRSALEATASAKEDMSKIVQKEQESRRLIKSLQDNLTDSENKCIEYSRQKSMLEDECDRLNTINIQDKKIIEKLTQEKLQMVKMHANEMKELVMRPTVDEVNVQLAELRGQLEEAKMTSQALKEALATSQLGS